MADYFKGYYLKHQKGGHTLCIIAGRSNSEKFIQVITDSGVWQVPFSEGHKFSRHGVILNIRTPQLVLRGKIRYGEFSPVRSDIMGPFRFFSMECRHGIISMHHRLYGQVILNGEIIDFTGGTGYIEMDSGRSFPSGYIWVHANDFTAACVPGKTAVRTPGKAAVRAPGKAAACASGKAAACTSGKAAVRAPGKAAVRVPGKTVVYASEKTAVRVPGKTAVCAPEEPCSIMAAVARIPFCGMHFRGCICAIQYQGKEYRLATYRGVRVLACTQQRMVLQQGKYRMEIRMHGSGGHRLRAPQDGEMTRMISESASCPAEFIFRKKGRCIFKLQSLHAGFEYEQ